MGRIFRANISPGAKYTQQGGDKYRGAILIHDTGFLKVNSIYPWLCPSLFQLRDNLYSNLYCTKCNNFSPKYIKIAGGWALALTQLEELIRLPGPPSAPLPPSRRAWRQWRIHRGGDGGDRPPYGFKKIFFLNIFTVKYWKIVDFLIKVVKITPKTHHPKNSPPVIHAGSYLRRRNRPENSSNYPPSNSRNFIDYSPLEIGRKTPPTTPPRIQNSRNFIDYPPLEIDRKTPPTTPPSKIHTELHRLPPLEIGRKTPPTTTPPRIHGTSSTTPPSKSGRKTRKLSPPVTRWSGSATAWRLHASNRPISCYMREMREKRERDG